MSGRATASPFPLTHKFNGQLLLELQGHTISDSLTTLLQRESYGTKPDLLLELATASFIYAKLGYYQAIAKTHDLCILRSGEVELLSITGAFSDWYRPLGYLRSVECLGHWFDSLCVQVLCKSAYQRFCPG